MFIKSLHLKNWLSHEDTAIALEALTIFRGENGSGKSSVEQALQMLFTARSESTADNGNGSRDLIRRGEDKASITAEILERDDAVHPIKMRCSITEKSGRAVQIKKESDPAWTGTDYLAYLALNRDVLDCLINGRRFIGLKDDAQKSLLAAVILPTRVVFDDWVEKAVNDCGLVLDWSKKAFDLIEEGYKNAYSERTAINRLIKEWREPDPVPVQEQDAQAIRARLADRQAVRTALAVERQKQIDASQQKGRQRADLGEKVSALEVKLAKEQSRRAEVAHGLLSKAKLKDAQDALKCADTAKSLDADLQRIAGELSAVERTYAAFDKLGDAGACPTCTQPITEAGFAAIVGPVIAQRDALLVEQRKTLEARKILGDYEGSNKTLSAHHAAEKGVKLVDLHIAEVEKEIDECKKELDASIEDPATEPDTQEFDVKIAELDTRIETGNQALTAAVTAEANRQHYQAAMEGKKKLDAKQALLEKLVEYFGPKGIQAKLLDEHFGGFEGRMNKVLEVWGFQAHLQFEPYSFGISFAGKSEIFSLKTISASQRWRFAVAFQVSLAKVTGINFLVVDAADILLDAHRSKLYGALMEAKLDQAIVLQSDIRTAIPNAKGCAFFMLTLDDSGEVPTTRVNRL